MSRNLEHGFSLLEMMVAITILGVGFAAYFSAMSAGLRNIDRVDSYEDRLEFARTKLAELELIEFARPGEEASGTLDDGTRWRFEVFSFLPVSGTDSASPNPMVRIAFTLDWQGRSEPQSLTFNTYKNVSQRPTAPSLREQLDALR